MGNTKRAKSSRVFTPASESSRKSPSWSSVSTAPLCRPQRERTPPARPAGADRVPRPARPRALPAAAQEEAGAREGEHKAREAPPRFPAGEGVERELPARVSRLDGAFVRPAARGEVAKRVGGRRA